MTAGQHITNLFGRTKYITGFSQFSIGFVVLFCFFFGKHFYSPLLSKQFACHKHYFFLQILKKPNLYEIFFIYKTQAAHRAYENMSLINQSILHFDNSSISHQYLILFVYQIWMFPKNERIIGLFLCFFFVSLSVNKPSIGIETAWLDRFGCGLFVCLGISRSSAMAN